VRLRVWACEQEPDELWKQAEPVVFADRTAALHRITGAEWALKLAPTLTGHRSMIVNSISSHSQPHLGASFQIGQPALIPDHELFDTFVTPQLMSYFHAKMPEVSHELLVRRLCELIKYLMLVQFSPGRILFGQEIDNVWHYWILQTRE